MYNFGRVFVTTQGRDAPAKPGKSLNRSTKTGGRSALESMRTPTLTVSYLDQPLRRLFQRLADAAGEYLRAVVTKPYARALLATGLILNCNTTACQKGLSNPYDQKVSAEPRNLAPRLLGIVKIIVQSNSISEENLSDQIKSSFIEENKKVLRCIAQKCGYFQNVFSEEKVSFKLCGTWFHGQKHEDCNRPQGKGDMASGFAALEPNLSFGEITSQGRDGRLLPYDTARGITFNNVAAYTCIKVEDLRSEFPGISFQPIADGVGQLVYSGILKGGWTSQAFFDNLTKDACINRIAVSRNYQGST